MLQFCSPDFLEPDVSSEESISTVEEQENETPPATSSETEQPKGEPENEEKEENKSSEETKKDEKDQSKEKEKKDCLSDLTIAMLLIAIHGV